MTKLRFKIFFFMILAAVVSITITGKLILDAQKKEWIEHHLEVQVGLFKFVESQLPQIMLDKQPEEINRLLKSLSTQFGTLKLDIYNIDGFVKFSSEKEYPNVAISDSLMTIWRKLELNDYQSNQELDDHYRLDYVSKIEKRPLCTECHKGDNNYVGFLNMETDLSHIKLDHERNLRIVSASSLLTIILFIIIISFVHLRLIQSRLKRILEAIAEVEKGNFTSHIKIRSDDELGRLADAFNNMIDQLSEMKYTLREAHRHQLEKADKLATVGELAAGMAHEIKNPIAGISAAMTVFLEEVDSNDPNIPVFKEIQHQAMRVDRAVNSLLSYARPLEPTFLKCDITVIMNNVLRFLSKQASKQNAEIKITVDENIPEIVVDPDQIEQVFLNICLNGIQSMPDGGVLSISQSISEDETGVEIRVMDNGIGIKEENLDKIFRPFYTSKSKGTGLGLAVTSGIVRRHGGRITVESAIDQGTTFIIILPMDGRIIEQQENSRSRQDKHNQTVGE